MGGGGGYMIASEMIASETSCLGLCHSDEAYVR